jgi:fermentation-respiration switch protein FrsA (DUF1100 family)
MTIRIGPRSLSFIHGTADIIVPPGNMHELTSAASIASNVHVHSWLVPSTKHIQSYHVMEDEYVKRVVAFLTAAPGSE